MNRGKCSKSIKPNERSLNLYRDLEQVTSIFAALFNISASKIERSIAMFFSLNGFGDLLIFVVVVAFVLIITKDDKKPKS